MKNVILASASPLLIIIAILHHPTTYADYIGIECETAFLNPNVASTTITYICMDYTTCNDVATGDATCCDETSDDKTGSGFQSCSVGSTSVEAGSCINSNDLNIPSSGCPFVASTNGNSGSSDINSPSGVCLINVKSELQNTHWCAANPNGKSWIILIDTYNSSGDSVVVHTADVEKTDTTKDTDGLYLCPGWTITIEGANYETVGQPWPGCSADEVVCYTLPLSPTGVDFSNNTIVAAGTPTGDTNMYLKDCFGGATKSGEDQCQNVSTGKSNCPWSKP